MKYVVPIPLKKLGQQDWSKRSKKMFLESLDQLISAAQRGSDNFCKVKRVEFNLANDCKIREISQNANGFWNLFFLFSMKPYFAKNTPIQ